MSAARLAAEVGALLGDQRAAGGDGGRLGRAGQARRGVPDRGEVLAGAGAARSSRDERERASANWAGRRLHFIGIGGAGMSGLALVCAGLGASVSGSDRADSSYMERLRAAGLEPAVGHDAANLPEDAEVVVSTAIGEDNPELRRRPRARRSRSSTAASCSPSSAPRSG